MVPFGSSDIQLRATPVLIKPILLPCACVSMCGAMQGLSETCDEVYAVGTIQNSKVKGTADGAAIFTIMFKALRAGEHRFRGLAIDLLDTTPGNPQPIGTPNAAFVAGDITMVIRGKRQRRTDAAAAFQSLPSEQRPSPDSASRRRRISPEEVVKRHTVDANCDGNFDGKDPVFILDFLAAMGNGFSTNLGKVVYSKVQTCQSKLGANPTDYSFMDADQNTAINLLDLTYMLDVMAENFYLFQLKVIAPTTSTCKTQFQITMSTGAGKAPRAGTRTLVDIATARKDTSLTTALAAHAALVTQDKGDVDLFGGLVEATAQSGGRVFVFEMNGTTLTSLDKIGVSLVQISSQAKASGPNWKFFSGVPSASIANSQYKGSLRYSTKSLGKNVAQGLARKQGYNPLLADVSAAVPTECSEQATAAPGTAVMATTTAVVTRTVTATRITASRDTAVPSTPITNNPPATSVPATTLDRRTTEGATSGGIHVTSTSATVISTQPHVSSATVTNSTKRVATTTFTSSAIAKDSTPAPASPSASHRPAPSVLVFPGLDYDIINVVAFEVTLRTIVCYYRIEDCATLPMTFSRGSIVATVSTKSREDADTIADNAAIIVASASAVAVGTATATPPTASTAERTPNTKLVSTASAPQDAAKAAEAAVSLLRKEAATRGYNPDEMISDIRKDPQMYASGDATDGTPAMKQYALALIQLASGGRGSEAPSAAMETTVWLATGPTASSRTTTGDVEGKSSSSGSGGSSPVVAIVIVLALALLAVGIIVYLRQKKSRAKQPTGTREHSDRGGAYTNDSVDHAVSTALSVGGNAAPKATKGSGRMYEMSSTSHGNQQCENTINPLYNQNPMADRCVFFFSG